MIQTLAALIVLSVVFFVLERVIGHARGPWFRREYWTDTAYWFFAPLITRVIARVVILLPFLLLVAAGAATVEGLRAREYVGFGPVSRQALWLQTIEVLLLADLIGYWVHRRFHRRRWWPFHAVHHSSEELDWLSSARVHPVNTLVMNLLQATPLLFVGFNPFAAASAGPLLTLYAVFLHARIDWTYGPVGRLIASPAFHRWHHSQEPEALDRNFAGLFAFWDVLFGTFYLPPDRAPRHFGIPTPMPSGLIAQLKHPFIRT